MIDEKKIEEAKEAFIADKKILGVISIMDLSCGFREGANWAINEFLKELWHPAIETPDLDKRILYEYKPNGEINPPTHIKEATYEKVRWKECGYKPINPERIITRWLYVDDLFTKEGGENHD